MNVGLVGVTGYSGSVLFELLLRHPNVDQVNLYGHAQTEAQSLETVMPQLRRRDNILPYNPADIMKNNQMVFFATSAGVTTELAKPFIDANFPVIDLAGDYRLKSRDVYKKWYKKEAPSTEYLNKSHYGLTDFTSSKGETYVSNPGCYATSTILALAPLVQNHLIDPTSIVVDAKSGTSGAGKKLTQLTHFSQTNENLQLYKVNQHQHIPEIVQQLQEWDENVPYIQFTTTLLPLTRGIMASCYAKAKSDVTEKDVRDAFVRTYSDDTFVNATEGVFPALKQVVGTNFCDIGYQLNPVTHQIVIVSVIDNLLKGAAGQAIQNFNQMFGFEPETGLNLIPVLPI
ncbi:N-acetyl-gamma-glutamyl-phosphate reductase [Companilactobacillus ginsenosidimutans]|uniref:N-acetyl-gamma-glutamyl-phosphate reductase n=1 Tax=Companilactobacillus ginsenosidimutans TaxID=1007676 RepID=A0A0H4QLB3_9LACO|nr:N-acetyl-gamma-glutamyl-phosphate reductase [Companilactobacillus ginsenosidimutans]AKP67886.1 N-acetyl-gamma-glutamyl-phosphate reductase [Companilactobacillus ginsenosidimutans]